MKGPYSRWWVLLLLPWAWVECLASDTCPHTYATQGVVEKISDTRQSVTIHHQSIPGYMMEMTMEFPVKNPQELNGISPGDRISFDLVVSPDQEWVEQLHRLGRGPVPTAADPMAGMSGVEFLKPGDLLPDIQLDGEDGRPRYLSDFRGKVVLLTFFFTRCPLPDYCPRMNQDFAETRKLLLDQPKLPTNWQMLSISFDPTFDQPSILGNYARLYRGKNSDRWLFASAPAKSLGEIGSSLGLMIMREESNISHNLRTVVVDTHGRLYQQFNDNLWTPQQMVAVVQAALRTP